MTQCVAAAANHANVTYLWMRILETAMGQLSEHVTIFGMNQWTAEELGGNRFSAKLYATMHTL